MRRIFISIVIHIEDTTLLYCCFNRLPNAPSMLYLGDLLHQNADGCTSVYNLPRLPRAHSKHGGGLHLHSDSWGPVGRGTIAMPAMGLGRSAGSVSVQLVL